MPSIKVYVVDDSAVVRQTLAHLLAGDPELELIGSAPNPLFLQAEMIVKCGEGLVFGPLEPFSCEKPR